ncbi:hypothetical protein [Methylomonas sp. UP202]|uniref:hypothetical protein n=1 Tax=unclassified Methylomonas TaxID=2608980 RepID=UPI0024792A6D|nr:hypothetical protein [Methylomonas sp. UP202]WGS88585.1 hypothetical protein QC632_24890 [Methylomonas sp. UP202]
MQKRTATARRVYPGVEQFDIFVIDWDKLPQFTEQEFSELRYRLLLMMLGSLNDGRVSAKEKSESREWLMSEDLTPFSFRACCESEGVDYLEMRDLILDHLKM